MALAAAEAQAQHPIPEGNSTTRVTVTIPTPVEKNVVVTITNTPGTAEPSDYSVPSSVTIPAGGHSGGFGISTYEDDDTDDETFTLTYTHPDYPGRWGDNAYIILDNDKEEVPTPSVSLSAAPNPVAEGSSVTVTARLSSALGSAVTIPVTLTDGTAESGDYGSLSSITIGSGSTTGTGTITTTADADTDDETFTVSLGTLPSSVTAGSPSSVDVTITDATTPPPTPSVSLSASPNPVAEGSSVTVTARLSSALGSAVTIPVTLTDGTAESGDYGSLSSITIGSGSTTGTGTITTTADADTDDETFTVSLGTLPSSVTAGSPSSVDVTITDATTPPPTPSVSLSASPNPVAEGSSVTVTARLSSALGSAVTIVTGTLSVSPEPTEVAALVDRARSTFLSVAGGRILDIDLPEDLPPVMADRARIVQVLGNLLSNAARHSPESAPVRVAAERDGVHVAVSVTDKGRGVPAERLPHLFRKHAAATGGDGVGGGGLGLTICKGLVEAHGGRIRAESGGPGRGTTFTFTVPLAEEAAGSAGPEPPPRRPSRKAREKTRILVVDDDPQMLRYVRDALTRAGYEAIVTGDCGELADLVRSRRPALVLLDLLLPGTDGIVLMERIPELGDLPVIFISAYGRDETVARALDAGATDYIVKPFSPSELTARVRAALRRRTQPEPFVLGELTVHYDQRRVTVAGRPVALTPTEYDLLRVLSVNAGRPLTYDSLLGEVWRRRKPGATDPKLVHAVARRLRGKLGDDPANPAYLRNQHGVGYLMPHPDGAH